MSDLVSNIENVVGCKRHPTAHIGRAVSSEQVVYIMHSQECVDSGIDLRECPYSVALDEFGIDDGEWNGLEDRPVLLAIDCGMIAPVAEASDGD